MARELDEVAFKEACEYIFRSEDYSIEKFMREKNIFKNADTSGRQVKVCCPFHIEDTPSLYIGENGKVFNCFGCGKHGGFLKFVSFYNKLVARNGVSLTAWLENTLATDAKMRISTGLSTIYKKQTRSLVELQSFKRKKVKIEPQTEIHDLGDLYDFMVRQGMTSLSDIKMAILYVQDGYTLNNTARMMRDEAAVGLAGGNVDMSSMDINSLLSDAGFSWEEDE